MSIIAITYRIHLYQFKKNLKISVFSSVSQLRLEDTRNWLRRTKLIFTEIKMRNDVQFFNNRLIINTDNKEFS